MMRARHTRQRQQYRFGAVVAVAVLFSALFLLTFYLPARTRYVQLQSEIESLAGAIGIGFFFDRDLPGEDHASG